MNLSERGIQPDQIEVVGENIVHQNGNFIIADEFLKGHYPNLGTLHQGYQGDETIRRVHSLRATHVITVVEPAKPATTTPTEQLPYTKGVIFEPAATQTVSVQA